MSTTLIANWKMNGDAGRAREWAFTINRQLADAPAHVQVVLCPPNPYLSIAGMALPGNARLKLGAQNCHAQTNGAFTGEVSAAMLKDCGCAYVILGHSERRVMGERDADVLAKAEAAIAAGLTPVICVGESQSEYEKEAMKDVLSAQLASIKGLPLGAYLIAYEPIWAIGTGKTPSELEIAAAHSHIKTVLGSGVHVLYGGSVKADNIGKILEIDSVSGALIGGASLEIISMGALITAAAMRVRK